MENLLYYGVKIPYIQEKGLAKPKQTFYNKDNKNRTNIRGWCGGKIR